MPGAEIDKPHNVRRDRTITLIGPRMAVDSGIPGKGQTASHQASNLVLSDVKLPPNSTTPDCIQRPLTGPMVVAACE